VRYLQQLEQQCRTWGVPQVTVRELASDDEEEGGGTDSDDDD
jgi:hypothetical protein